MAVYEKASRAKPKKMAQRIADAAFEISQVNDFPVALLTQIIASEVRTERAMYGIVSVQQFERIIGEVRTRYGSAK